MLSFRKLKRYNSKLKYTVSGYIRRQNSSLSLYSSIPEMISYICLAFYSHGEYLSNPGDKIRISDDQMTISRIDNEFNVLCSFTKQLAATGCIIIDSTIDQVARWTDHLQALRAVHHLSQRASP